jgi:hypothetical protein
MQVGARGVGSSQAEDRRDDRRDFDIGEMGAEMRASCICREQMGRAKGRVQWAMFGWVGGAAVEGGGVEG